MPKKSNKSPGIEIGDIKTIWRIVVKNAPIVLIFLLLSWAVATFYTYKLTNVYAARTQILLKSFDEYTPNSIISDAQGSVGQTYKSYVDNTNEMRVFRSYDLLEKAIKKLKLEVSYFIEGRLRVTEVYEGTPFRIDVINLNPGLYEKIIKFKILNDKEFELTYEKKKEEVKRKFWFDVEIVDPDFRMLVRKTGEINSSTIKVLSTINYHVKIHSLNTLVNRYLRALSVVNPDYTNVLQVTLEDQIARRAEVLLDTLSQVYIQNTLKQRFEINQNTLFYIDRQMEDVVSVLNSIEDTLIDFKEKYNILNLPREEEDYFEKLSMYDQQKSSYQLMAGALNALEDYIISNKDPEFLPPNIYVDINDNFLLKNVSELYGMQINRNEMLTRATENSFAVKELDRKLELIKKDLLIYISNTRAAVKSRIADVEKQIDKYIASIKSIPEKQRGLMNIQRKEKVNEGMYLFLLQKRANTIIARAGIIPLTKVIENPRSIGVIKPNRQRITLFFLAGGLIIALIIVFVRVLFYEKIESIDELKAKTDLPVVGEILFNKQMKELTIPVESDPRSPITESFRTIRTNLQYMAPDAKSKTIVITSNNPGEGKTFCSINLAAILAKAGKKVLLLELDLHKPRVQKGLNMSSDIGISTILIGKNKPEECVLHSQIENLDVILSGPIPPNASELLLSDHQKTLLEFGKKNYDYVVIDTPPVGLISDAMVLMSMSDISLFVLNTKFAYREAITNAHEIVAINKLTNFGFILNGVKRKRSRYYYNRYAYGYGYGYGYGGRYGYGYRGYGGYYGGGYGDSDTTKK